MKKFFKKLFVVAGLVTSFDLMANQWYYDVDVPQGRVEQAADGVIWLMRPTELSQTGVMINGCNINQIKLIPPAGREDAWLSLVMAAVMSDKTLNVKGTCDTANTQIVGTRLVLNYSKQ